MSLKEKLNVIEALCFTDSSGVVWRLPSSARSDAEQRLLDNPALSLQDVLLRVPLEEPLPIPCL